MANSIPLSQLCNTVLNVTNTPLTPGTFNAGLIIGTSAVIPTAGANARVQAFPSVNAMLSAGFNLTSLEVLAATAYFAFQPAPNLVYIGRQNLSALKTITLAAAGTGYVTGDALTIVQNGATLGQAVVSSVNGTGGVTGYALGVQGDGYSVATALPVTGGKGTGATFNVTAVGESPLQALVACTTLGTGFWGVNVTSATDADNLAINSYIETFSGKLYNFWVTSDVNVPNNVTPNAAAITFALGQKNNAMFYATVQNGIAPQNAYIAAEVMGAICGLNSSLASSYFTASGLTLNNAIPEPLTFNQVLNLKAINVNAYINYGDVFKFIEPGVSANGTGITTTLFTAMLANDLQYAMLGVIAANRNRPLTDLGQQLFLKAATAVGQKYVNIGFLAPDIYTGQPLSNLTTKQSLITGYFVQSPSYATLSAANKAAGIAQPVYFNGLEAGSANSITIGINLQ